MDVNKLYNVVKSPRISEKAVLGTEKSNHVLFNVALNATKNDIKVAVEKLFDVTVESVQTVRMKGKTKKTRQQKFAKRPDFKKAYVKLAEGQSISDFQGSE